MKFIRFLLMSITFCFASTIFGKALIWDIGYTLIEPNNLYVGRQIGIMDCISLFVTHGKMAATALNDSLYDVLMSGEEEHLPCLPNAPEGRIMPIYMREWIQGDLPNKEILKHALCNVDAYPDFLNARHKRMIQKVLRWMFNPREFAQGMRPMFRASNLLRRCARVKDGKGNQKHEFYILTNWDEESFDYLYKSDHNKRIFKYFKRENIYISSVVKDFKPKPSIFMSMLEKYNLNPEDCIYIDDKRNNIGVARECGMKAVQIRNGNYRNLRQKLCELGVFN